MKCIKNKDGLVIRTSNRNAERRVNDKKLDWVYVPKSEWKGAGRKRDEKVEVKLE